MSMDGPAGVGVWRAMMCGSGAGAGRVSVAGWENIAGQSLRKAGGCDPDSSEWGGGLAQVSPRPTTCGVMLYT